jgi:hypothetical protein
MVKYTYKKGNPFAIQTPKHWKLIGHSMTSMTPVITQQYFSATLVSMRFHSRKEEFGAFQKCCSTFFSFL